MAGIEKLEIHSKSYILRWVKVDDGHTISWSVQPHKKSINFGIVKHPGSGATNLTAANVDELNRTFDNVDSSGTNAKSGRFSKRDNSTAQEQLASKGFIPMKWHGKCEADKVSMGTYDVQQGEGGMFGLVFDNTFSKQTSKTATFVLLTFPTGQPPQGAHHLPNLQAGPNAAKSATSLGKPSSRLGAAASESVVSLQRARANSALSVAGRSDPGHGAASVSVTYHTGNLLKRRRKKGQGFARRFFSLDFSSCTLSYYYNRNSSALRGAIPLSLAAIAADERRREINIDSGAEVWHLRASNAKDFTDWAKALEKASRIARGMEPGPATEDPTAAKDKLPVPPGGRLQIPNQQQEEDREWQQVESLVSHVVGTRDALRRLVKDMAAQKQFMRPSSSYLSPGTPSVIDESEGYFSTPPQERRPFWRRKSTATHQPVISSVLAVPSPASVATITPSETHPKRKSKGPEQEERSIHDHCAALLNNLDTVVAEFTTVIGKSKRRRAPAPTSATGSRQSLESTASTDEFFDAEAGETDSRAQVMMIDRQSEEDSQGSEADDGSIHSSSSVSSVDDEEPMDANSTVALFPAKPKSLAPLPLDIGIERRRTIAASTVLPPSLIAFVRKNVGKDLSTISMPVSANEPTSLLQRVSEQLEYAQLLDVAAKLKTPKERMLYVSAFAVSQFSGNRAKERSIRKPFNPLLGETFELLRTESEVPGGFRLIVEKVCHRPVRLAMHADSANWSLAQSPAPTQKFWGKSAELTTEGKVRIALRLADGTDELYSWNIATMFLRNVVMGEKYVEPVGSMAICNESTGAKANIEFRSKGMFGGRGEDVQVETYGPDGVHTGTSLTGTWTSALHIVETGRGAGKEIWRVGELVPNAANTYGMTTFAASLNEITEIERGRMPITDTRLRPDQRFCESGKLDEAEEQKVILEEAQRVRRRDYEARGEEWKPRWFVRIGDGQDGEEVWKLKSGKEGYWETRERGFKDAGLEDLFRSSQA
ncbi:oxysterol-binding protein [Pseudomassariella vexata]|uniref:Oxysterol-binding protein n=1 Tax=Pseudomassariella vexata TaxID=1141098 RepID=A0A1Y2E2C0_9PEZI|nr:oxysterol-binding protein [Pseudomassariella vexata]ORY65466.1 oxysterol-binding protein [Pseudomassariella vexata]